MILMNDLRGSSSLRAEELDACKRVIDSGRYVLGGEVERFESTWAATCQTRHAIGVGNGMDAIEIGLRSLGIGPGNEVITTPMTAFATVLAVIRSGATPVFADIDPSTAMLDPDSVRRCLSPRTSALLLVHLYGQVGPVEELLEICGQRNLLLIEDCAQAHMAQGKKRPVGSSGALAAWSFYPTKNLGAIGDGGAITTADDEVAANARRLRNYGQSSQYEHDTIGLNSRLDELQASILSVRLKHLQKWTQRRRQIGSLYHRQLANSEASPLPPPEEKAAHSYHLFVVTSPHRDALQAHLAESRVQTLIHYPIPAHLQRPCRDIVRDPRGLDYSEAHANTCLSLPCHPGLSDDDVGEVSDAVLSFRP